MKTIQPCPKKSAYDSIYNMASLLKERGYKITLCYIDLPIKACIERNFYRFIDEFMQGIPCRLVPFSTIIMGL